jgi:non-ribosomal peptide synthetase component F
MLARGVVRDGPQVAASSSACQLTFEELHRGAHEVRRKLTNRSGDISLALVRMAGNPEDLIAVLGVLWAGWHLIVSRSGQSYPTAAELAPDAFVVGRTVHAYPRNRKPGKLKRRVAQCAESCMFVTSSGSTGHTTLVGFTHSRVFERADVECSGMRVEDVVALGSSLGSFSGVVLALAALQRGVRLVFEGTGSTSAEAIAVNLDTLGVTRWSCSATLLAAVLVHWRAGGLPSDLQRIEVRGEELSHPLARRVLQEQESLELWHTYGLTESGQGCSWRVTEEDVRRRSFVPIGSTRIDPHMGVRGGEIVIADGRPPVLVYPSGPRDVGSQGLLEGLATGDAGLVHLDDTIEYRGRIGETLEVGGGAFTSRTAARQVMDVFPQAHAIGLAGSGVICVSGDRALDSVLGAASREWGFPIVRLADPPRLSSGKLDRNAVASAMRPNPALGHIS